MIAGASGYRGSVAAPVRVGGHVWGAVLASTSRPQPIPPHAESRLAQFAELVGVAIANADDRARLAARASEDSVTGLANHRAFHERLRDEVARAQRHGRDLSLVLLDLDHFKQVNDAYGHQTGDQVLAEVGRRLAGVSRAEDMVARVGGEEFGWILPEADAMRAYAAAERAREAVAGAPFPPVGRITISAGVCELAQASGANGLFRLADGALYWAKRQGRNVTYLYSPEVVEVLSADERSEQLERERVLASLRALARAIDAKDSSTQSHSERVGAIAQRLALASGWSEERAAELREAGIVHDVGKVGVPDAVLLKPGRLEPEEYEQVKEHAERGATIVSEVLNDEQVSWVRHHHERWDGQGYPDGCAARRSPTARGSWPSLTPGT
jgi:diguanylate cyclase (GGDEF)-like protein